MTHTCMLTLPRMAAVSVAAVCALMTSAALGADCDPASLQKLPSPNTRPVLVLSQLDIDGDGLPDGAIDSDKDGLPDNWEQFGTEGPSLTKGLNFDRVVPVSAPTAIGPGTPPDFVFARRAVTTDACNWDTDGDGLSDFIEVFGLKYIDDNNNGKLDFFWTDLNGNGMPDLGEQLAGSEWFDGNLDGLPSVGEFPLANVDATLNRQFDFDGFVFTDPTNPDTDGDGLLDGEDPDPLINPLTFNVQNLNFFTRGSNTTDVDFDNDGLGNGSDFGNDLIDKIDTPSDLTSLLSLFRGDLLQLNPPVVPEAIIEDLLGVDWNGDGLSRNTDVLDWTPVVTATQLTLAAFPEFNLGGRQLFFEQSFTTLQTKWNAQVANPFTRRNIGLGYQLALRNAGGTFTPDTHIWAILYAWRVPGFDINGNGFIGVPSAARGTTAAREGVSTNAAVALSPDGTVTQAAPYADLARPNAPFFAFDDRIELATSTSTISGLDGQITSSCGTSGLATMTLTFGGLLALRLVSGRRRLW
jgi:hypothetical protein